MFPLILKTDWMTLYSYPFLMGVGWALGYIASEHFIAKNHRNLLSFFPYIFLGYFLSAWIGAKALFLLTTTPVQRLMYGESANFWLGGGFVFYGGLIFSLIYTVVLYFFIRKKVSFKFFIELLPGLTLGHSVGRIGCLLAGCCFGIESHSFLAIPINGVSRIPVQLFESVALFIIFLIINKMMKQGKHFIGCSFYFLSYGVFRFFIEYFRADDIRGHWGVLTTSQWISLIMIFLGIFFAVTHARIKERTL